MSLKLPFLHKQLLIARLEVTAVEDSMDKSIDMRKKREYLTDLAKTTLLIILIKINALLSKSVEIAKDLLLQQIRMDLKNVGQ